MQIKTTPDRYLIIDGLKLCQIDGQELIFFDRNKPRRCKRKAFGGDEAVRVNVLDLVRAVANAEKLPVA